MALDLYGLSGQQRALYTPTPLTSGTLFHV